MQLLSQPLASPQLIARALHLEALQDVLGDASAGGGRCVVLTAEAGGGKSRLLQELCASPGVAGYWLLQGNCTENSADLVYAPLHDLLRRHLASLTTQERDAAALGSLADRLAKLVPELAWSAPEVTPGAGPSPELERQRLFEALMQFLVQLAATRPVLMIVEDIHWSDEASLEFLHLLARRLPALPICLLLTARPHAGSAVLDRFLSQLNRERLAVELPLPPLSRDGVDAMLRALFDWDTPVNPPLLNAIYALTEGNPFFVEEVASALVARGDIAWVAGRWQAKALTQLDIPHSLRLIVQGHLRQLSAEATDLLALAAVAGRSFDFDLLARLTGYDESTLLRLIRELVAARLVVEQTPDTFAFRHALTREAIYAGLLSRERRHQHRVIAAFLARETGQRDDSLAQLAYHSFEAGLWQPALDYGLSAGAQALRRFAPHAALAHLDRAATAAEHLQQPLPRALRQARGQAQQMVGNFAAAQADFEALLAEARARDDRRGQWQALHDLGFLSMASDYAQAGRYLQEALAVARWLDEPAALARSLNRLGNWLANIGQPLEALVLHQEALSIVEIQGDQPGLAATLDLIATAHGITGNTAASVAHYRRALPLFETLGDRQGMASTLMMLTTGGDIEAGKQAVALTQEIGWRDGEAYAHVRLAIALAICGSFGPALQHARQGLEIAAAIDHKPWQTAGHLSLGIAFLQMTIPAEAIGHLEIALQLARASGAAVWVDSVRAWLALAEAAAGNIERAATLLAGDEAPRNGLVVIGRRFLAYAQAEVALAQGEPQTALAVIDVVFQALPDLRAWQDDTLPLFLELQGRALAVLERADDAVAALTEAIDLCRSYELRPLHWRCHGQLAQLALARRDRPTAEAQLAASGEIIAALAASLHHTGLEDKFLQATRALLPELPELTALQQSKQAAGGLTQREREVALLVTEGKTNRAIAAELFISVRTVKSHITNILTKLDLTSRSQLAVWVVESGLRDDIQTDSD